MFLGQTGARNYRKHIVGYQLQQFNGLGCLLLRAVITWQVK